MTYLVVPTGTPCGTRHVAKCRKYYSITGFRNRLVRTVDPEVAGSSPVALVNLPEMWLSGGVLASRLSSGHSKAVKKPANRIVNSRTMFKLTTIYHPCWFTPHPSLQVLRTPGFRK